MDRVTKIIEGTRRDLEHHAATCGDRVLGIALNPSDHEALCVVELWGLRVLAWDEVPAGSYRILCEANGVLVPRVDTFEELMDRWEYDLQPPEGVPVS